MAGSLTRRREQIKNYFCDGDYTGLDYRRSRPCFIGLLALLAFSRTLAWVGMSLASIVGVVGGMPLQPFVAPRYGTPRKSVGNILSLKRQKLCPVFDQHFQLKKRHWHFARTNKIAVLVPRNRGKSVLQNFTENISPASCIKRLWNTLSIHPSVRVADV